MSTTVQQPSRSTFDRLTAWILDPDGVMYGDEQERLRYYESSAIVVTLQAILVPWALAVCAWVGGRPVAPYLLAVAVLYLAPWFVGAAYVRRRRVRRLPTRISAAFVATSLLVYLPYPLLCVGLAVGFTEGTRTSFVNGLIGGLIAGTVAGVVVLVVGFLRARRTPDPAAVPDEDDL
jgi:hypothetical protein